MKIDKLIGCTFLGLAVNKKHTNKIAKIVGVTKEDILYNIEFKIVENKDIYTFNYIVELRGIHALHGKTFNNKLVMEIAPGYKIEFISEL